MSDGPSPTTGRPRTTVLIAQGRMGSTRLPGKTMMDLGGGPVVDRVLERASRAAVDEVVLACPELAEDDLLAERVSGLGYRVVRGSAQDVLSRYAKAAEESSAEVVVRVTCDCPLIDPEVIDRVVDAFFEEPLVDYCSNTLERSYPIGMDCEVVSREALETANAEASHPEEREHVTPFLYRRPERFLLRNVKAPEWARRPGYRLTVDEAADLELAREVVRRLGADARLRDVVGLLDADAGLRELNAAVGHRNVEKHLEW
ncbi:MAG: glycosyltransferase family protein [Coriobacteriia bacterium]|nr:glycosyltransferase family protein [Coriobacteriia bacterium]